MNRHRHGPYRQCPCRTSRAACLWTTVAGHGLQRQHSRELVTWLLEESGQGQFARFREMLGSAMPFNPYSVTMSGRVCVCIGICGSQKGCLFELRVKDARVGLIVGCWINVGVGAGPRSNETGKVCRRRNFRRGFTVIGTALSSLRIRHSCNASSG